MENNTNNSLSAFWKRPEGKPGMILLAGLFAAGGYALYKALPTIIKLMENLYYGIGLAVGLVLFFSLIMNNKFRTTVWYLYKGLIRAFTGMVVELNPIAIMESYVEDIKDKMRKMSEQITELSGQIGKIAKKIQERTAEYNLAVDRMKVANNKGDRATVTLYARQSERLKAYIDKLEKLHVRMKVLYEMLKKMEYYSDIMVQDTQMQVSLAKDEREAITKSHSIMKSAVNIINGNNDKKMIFDQAMENVLDDIGSKVGAMDRMLEVSTNFITGVDLDDEVYAERGLKMLEEFDNESIDKLFGGKDAKKALPNNAPVYLNQQKAPAYIPNNSKPSNGEDKGTGTNYF